MTPRPAMLGETPLSESEAAYLHHDHDLWTAPKNTAMPVNAANGWHVSEPSDLELNFKESKC